MRLRLADPMRRLGHKSLNPAVADARPIELTTNPDTMVTK